MHRGIADVTGKYSAPLSKSLLIEDCHTAQVQLAQMGSVQRAWHKTYKSSMPKEKEHSYFIPLQLEDRVSVPPCSSRGSATSFMDQLPCHITTNMHHRVCLAYRGCSVSSFV